MRLFGKIGSMYRFGLRQKRAANLSVFGGDFVTENSRFVQRSASFWKEYGHG